MNLVGMLLVAQLGTNFTATPSDVTLPLERPAPGQCFKMSETQALYRIDCPLAHEPLRVDKLRITASGVPTLTLTAETMTQLLGKPGQCLRAEDILAGKLRWIDCKGAK